MAAQVAIIQTTNSCSGVNFMRRILAYSCFSRTALQLFGFVVENNDYAH